MAKKLFGPLNTRPFFSAGTWTASQSSNIMQWAKAAADETPTVVFSIPRNYFGSSPSGEPVFVSAACQYTVGTAALDAAPTVTINKLSMNDSTKAITRTAVANTKTVAGTDTTGTAAGTYTVKGAADQPLALADNEYLEVAFAFNCAATTVLTIRALEVETA